MCTAHPYSTHFSYCSVECEIPVVTSQVLDTMSSKSLCSLPLALGASGSDKIPSVGFGCWKVPKEVAAEVVFSVIKAGYRHLDCAADYGNEKEVRTEGEFAIIYLLLL